MTLPSAFIALVSLPVMLGFLAQICDGASHWGPGLSRSHIGSPMEAPAPSHSTSPSYWQQGTYINCGGSAFNGNYATWAADKYTGSGQSFVNSRDAINFTAFTKDADKEQYFSMRYFGSQDLPYNIYSIPVPYPSYYWVRLHFAEIMYRLPAQRSFHISIEGAQVLTNFELPLLTAISKEFFVPVTDGAADVALIRGSRGDPCISGISVVAAPSGMYSLSISKSKEIWGTEHRLAVAVNSTIRDLAGRQWSPDHGVLKTEKAKQATQDISCFPPQFSSITNTDEPPDLLPLNAFQVIRSTYNREELSEVRREALVPLRYQLAVAASARCCVRLGFAEQLFETAGARFMNISIDGQLVASFLDVIAKVPASTAWSTQFYAKCPETGQMEISLTIAAYSGFTWDAFVNAVEVFEVFVSDEGAQSRLSELARNGRLKKPDGHLLKVEVSRALQTCKA